ncbi:MAG TPA: GNAT family N-acetyltransferase [Acidimicrobiales bacterium]
MQARAAGAAAAVTVRQRETWDRMMATNDLTQYVATDPGGEIVGIVSLLVMPNLGYDCRPTAFIEAMVVAEPHRRHGVGRLLLERLLADAAAAGCHKVQLLAHKRHAHDGAHDFYRALGFEAEAEGFRLYLGPR